MSEPHSESAMTWIHITLCVYFPLCHPIPKPLEMSGFNVAPWPSCVMALKEELRVRVYFPRTLEAGWGGWWGWSPLKPLWVSVITEGLFKEM